MLRTLAHHWRVNLAVALGAAVASTVLAGALLVGDSVRGSLRTLTLERLGTIDQALVSQRFFREALADDLAGNLELTRSADNPVPAIVLRGTATDPDSGARASRIGIHGVDRRFAALFGTELELARAPGQLFASAVVNQALRSELGVEAGDALLLSFGRFSQIPRDTLMGDKDPEDVLGSMRVTVTAVIPDRGIGRFGLSATQQRVPNVFVALPQLQRALDLERQVNALLLPQLDRPDLQLDKRLQLSVTNDDLGLVLRRYDDHLAVESREFVLRPSAVRLIEQAAEQVGLPLMHTQSYLANAIRAAERSIPYSLVTALDPLNNGQEWATLLMTDGTRARLSGDDSILLNSWAAEDLDVRIGETIELDYYVVDAAEQLSETTTRLRVEGVVAMQGLGADRRLTPDYPGMQEAEDISAWDPPFPVDLDRIRSRDELYWDRFGATPKAFVSRAAGSRLWSTRYGNTTAVLLGTAPGDGIEQAGTKLAQHIAGLSSPDSFGLKFRPVREEGLRAASGATDFAMLFVSFSFFLILSAALLVGLLFRLGVERRAGEIGLLLAVGHTVSKVRRGLLAEGSLLAAAGGLVGLAGAVGFAGAMMVGLRTIWRPAVGSSELFLHVTPQSLGIGWAGTLLVVLLSVYFAVRKLVRLPPPQLLAGTVARPALHRGGRSSLALAWGGLAGALMLVVVAVASGSSESPGLAFGTGSLLLVAGLAFFSRWCRGSRRRRVSSALTGMAARNSSWSPGRSVLSVALVGAASFMIVVVEVFRIEPGADLERLDSGAGGFRLVAESDIPLHQNLNLPADLFDLGFDEEGAATLADATIWQARVLAGDDASCNNLYAPEQPTVMGVPSEFIRRGGFRIKQLLDRTDGRNPWLALESRLDGGAVPAMVDANSAQWILKKKLGDELVLDDELDPTPDCWPSGLLFPQTFLLELRLPIARKAPGLSRIIKQP